MDNKDFSRLFLLLWQIALVHWKLAGLVEASWWLILAPMWLPFTIIFIVYFVVAVAKNKRH